MLINTKCTSLLSVLVCSIAMFSAIPSAMAQDEPQDTPAQQPQIDDAPAIEEQIPETISAPLYSVRPVDTTDADWSMLGSFESDTGTLAVQFTSRGAGIESLQLPGEYETLEKKNRVTLQKVHSYNGWRAVPFAALSVDINGTTVGLAGEHVWKELSPGVFEAIIVDRDENPVARIERRFDFTDGHNFSFTVAQTIENLGDEELVASLSSTGAIDLPKAKSTYAGDRRRVRYGFLQSPAMQKGDLTVVVDDDLKNRASILGKRNKTNSGTKVYDLSAPVWPTEKTAEHGRRLSWIGLSDRYFAVLMHPEFDPLKVTTPEEKLLAGVDSIDRLVLNTTANAMDTVLVLRMNGQAHTIVPGADVTNTLGVFAGPRTKPIFNEDPLLVSLNVPEMVVYNLGGFCAPCTFSWLTDILISVLRMFHSLVGDWAISILMLVILVRSCLHPITRWSQIRMQRFGVQMQSMGPKQKILREKYKNDSKKMQQEMSKLWREEGISPTGMLGCLPMLLQSPVWIALYATLFFAVELRHEAAFYGVFQSLTGGAWHFMYDLSMPDGAIPLPKGMHFSFPLWGTVTAINILPLLLGVVFFAHQKYLTPPTQATMTPEQASQQKMMKVMMVVMFPLMMYTAPSGLALYFITNSSIAIVENKWIRAHMNKHGMLDIDNIRASSKNKGPGFLARMAEAAEAQKQLKEKGPRPHNPNSRRNGPTK